MPNSSTQSRWKLYCIALLSLLVASKALQGAIASYGRPIGGIFVDPDLLVSNLGLPTWSGIHQGLRFPDRIVEVEGHKLGASNGDYPARLWDRMVNEAAAAGHSHLHIRVVSSKGIRELTVAIESLSSSAWWLYAGSLFLVAGLYVGAALIAMAANPQGVLAQTFVKAALSTALFLFTLFDFHTTRNLVPVFHVAYWLVPASLFILPLRLPDDIAIVRRFPQGILILEGSALTMGLVVAFCYRHSGVGIGLQIFCSKLLGVSLLFFVVIMLLRYFRAQGHRRDTLRAIIRAIVPTHIMIGVGVLLATQTSKGSFAAFFAAPTLALLPLSILFTAIRYDLWGSRSLLSRFLTRGITFIFACTVSIAIGTALTASSGVALDKALLASTVGTLLGAVLVITALHLTDRHFFPSRADYKPTTEQLSELLTSISSPKEVIDAVERTVRRWLPCDNVTFIPAPQHGEPVFVQNSQSGAHFIRGDLHAAKRNEELILTLSFRNTLLATLRVGAKRGGALFTTDDTDLLRTIGNQAALALAHANAYAELEERRLSQAAAWRDEREAIVETVAAEIAHEIRYPINFFRSIFRRGSSAEQLDAEEVEIGCEEVDRLERLVSGLRKVSSRRLERYPICLMDLITKAELLLRDQLGTKALQIDIPPQIHLRCDPDQATQILINLVSNALEASTSAGCLGICWRAVANAGELIIWDTGPGFTVEPSKLFAPWFTTKLRGTGLGLAITHRLVRAHGWSIDAQRREGTTRFVVVVPSTDIVSLKNLDQSSEVA